MGTDVFGVTAGSGYYQARLLVHYSVEAEAAMKKPSAKGKFRAGQVVMLVPSDYVGGTFQPAVFNGEEESQALVEFAGKCFRMDMKFIRSLTPVERGERTDSRKGR